MEKAKSKTNGKVCSRKSCGRKIERYDKHIYSPKMKLYCSEGCKRVDMGDHEVPVVWRYTRGKNNPG